MYVACPWERRETAHRSRCRADLDAASENRLMNAFYFIADDALVGDVGVVTIGGELDYAATQELRERIFGQIAAGRRHLLLDLSDVTFIDSTAIGVIFGAMSKLRTRQGGSLAVVCPGGEGPSAVSYPDGPNNVRQIFRITGLDADVTLCDSREEAISQLAVAS
jgi:anti-sigma B factor antagonist